MPARRTTAILWVLVLVFCATSVWLWRELRLERSGRPQVEVARSSSSDVPEVASPAPIEPEPAPNVEQNGHEYFDEKRFKRGLIHSGDDPRLRQSAEYMEARRQYLEASFDHRYPDLVRVLKVPKETALRIVELSPEEEMRWFGVWIDKTSQDSLWLEQQQKAYAADVEIAALVGEAKLEQWKEYEASISERHQIRQFRIELMDSAEPLGSDTAELLIRALHEERQRIEEEARAKSGSAPGDDLEEEAESERRMLKAAEEVLSSYQFEAFRKMLERQRKAQSASERMQQAGMEALK